MTAAKNIKKTLKLKRRHKGKGYRVGKHLITNKPTAFEFTKESVKELENDDCKHWVKIIEDKK